MSVNEAFSCRADAYQTADGRWTVHLMGLTKGVRIFETRDQVQAYVFGVHDSGVAIISEDYRFYGENLRVFWPPST